MSEDDVASAYDRWSASYDTVPNATRDLDARVLRAQPLNLGGRDVELGAGTGKNTVWLARHARSVVAIDFSSGMLARARERVRGANTSFVRHDIRGPLPLAAGAADVIVVDLVLEHLADVGPVFREAARVLRARGLLYVCELHPARQLRGGQAQFANERGETEYVPAYLHDTSDFVQAALAAGFVLRALEEWRDRPDSPRTELPRLLSLLFAKSACPDEVGLAAYATG